MLLLVLLLGPPGISYAQNSPDTMKQVKPGTNADDPANFLTRTEVFNDLQHYGNDVNINQSVLRNIVQIGKRFSTRLDLPYVYNSSTSSANNQPSGIGDISIRLLGYKIIDNPKSAITASLEVSFNSAQSPMLGTGKNMLIPVVSFTRPIPKKKILLSMILQQTNAVSGDEKRENVSFSKVQFLILKTFTRKTWMFVSTEWYIDYVHGGVSLNLTNRFIYAPKPLINIWMTTGAGIFGDFIGRYQWRLEIGSRYYLFRKINSRERLNKL